MNNFNPFYLISHSPWPIMISLSLMNNFFYFINFMNKLNLLSLSFLSSMLCLIQWWRDVIRELSFQGLQSYFILNNFHIGMILFIISEIFFFISFFWSFFHSSLAPSIEIGQMWPPSGIYQFNPYDIPLLNTIILISSGISITWSHHSIIKMNYTESFKSLFFTIILGFYFSIIQIFEYIESPFSMSDSIYGSIFFISTGFHGIHVIIGSIFLLICLIRLMNLHFSSKKHFGFEAATWYWHFVDIIWLFLYMSIYWWSY